jgi:flagellar FliL protein
MANNDESDDLDLGEEMPGKKKLLIIIALIVMSLFGGGVAAYFVLYSGSEETTEVDQEASEESEEMERGPARYVKMEPAFVINLPGNPSLLQVGVSLRVFDEQMVEFIKYNDPMLRHHLINLMQSKEAANLKDRAAKETLQTEMLDEVNRIVEELSGPGEVDALYFTGFVMQ